MLKIGRTATFKRDIKSLKKKGYDLKKLEKVINHIVNEEKEILVNQYRDHQLSGGLKEFRELHIEADWLLVYKIYNDKLMLMLVTTDNHDNVFRKAKNYR